MVVHSRKAELAAFVEEGSFLPTRGQRYILRRFHPRAVILDVTATMWAVYFFWNHQWLAALVAVAAGRLGGMALAWKMNYRYFAQTLWGRLAILHLHPANLSLQTLGVVVLFYGLWMHATVAILTGLSVVFLGHSFGWSKVVRGLRLER